MHITSWSDVTAIIAIISFFGGITMYLFKKIVMEPLKKSIDMLNQTIKDFRDTAENRMEKSEKRIDKAEDRIDKTEDRLSRHDEKFITVFNTLNDLKGVERHE